MFQLKAQIHVDFDQCTLVIRFQVNIMSYHVLFFENGNRRKNKQTKHIKITLLLQYASTFLKRSMNASQEIVLRGLKAFTSFLYRKVSDAKYWTLCIIIKKILAPLTIIIIREIKDRQQRSYHE